MGHALGLGAITAFKCGNLCHQGVTDVYECGKANTEYYKIFGDTKLLHLSSATGTCDHWTENSFPSNYQSELMTPYFDPDKRNPLTAVSIASLADLGYEVNIDGADLWYPDEFFEDHKFKQLRVEGGKTAPKGRVIELNEQNMIRFKPIPLPKKY